MKTVWQKLSKIPNWLCGLLFLVLILRIPSFFEPYYYGDEMIYMTLGQGVRQGLTLFKDVYDNKPPLLYLTAALAENLFLFKVILASWSIVTIVAFYKLSELFFPNEEKTRKTSTVIFALLTTLPLLEGNTVNSEIFMIGFTIFGLLMLLKPNLTTKKIFTAGILFGLGTLFKIPAAFDAPVIVIYWLITGNLKEDWKKIFKNTIILILGFAFPIILTFAWYFLRGSLPEYIKAAFLQNVGYLSSFRPRDVQKSFLDKNAPLLIRGVIVLIGVLVTWFFRKKLSSKFVLFTIWTLFSLFAITLSERPYPHYFIQALAPVSLLLGILVNQNSLEQSLAIIPLLIAFFVPVYYKFYFYPTASYYMRFINFTAGRITRIGYFNSFDTNTSRNYQIAEFLSQSSEPIDRVFMWDPASPTVYALARRLPPVKYVVPYHVADYSNRASVAKELTAKPPKFIILTAGNPYPEISGLIKKRYILITQIGNADIYSRRDSTPGN